MCDFTIKAQSISHIDVEFKSDICELKDYPILWSMIQRNEMWYNTFEVQGPHHSLNPVVHRMRRSVSGKTYRKSPISSPGFVRMVFDKKFLEFGINYRDFYKMNIELRQYFSTLDLM